MKNSELSTADINWEKLGFSYLEVPYRFHATFENGQWSEGELIEKREFTIEEGATALNYGQQAFEGMKARATQTGQVALFRPEMNAQRLQRSAERLSMQPVPEALFMRAVRAVTKANAAFIPPYTAGEAAFYLRPLLLGVGDNLGLQPAQRYRFIVYGSPVGSYFPTDDRSITLTTCKHDRAATRGTGHIKAGGNYAGTLIDRLQAKEAGFDEVLYLDSATRTLVDEAGSANLFAVKNGQIIIPESPSILPSITRLSLVDIAHELGIDVIERPLAVSELADVDELGCCGTAVTVASVRLVRDADKTYEYPSQMGPVTEQLFKAISSIQSQEAQMLNKFSDWLSWIE